MTVPRVILSVIGSICVLTGCFIFAAPKSFYDMIPGLSQMGPFNAHFVGDVGLAYLSGGAILVAGGLLADRRVALAGGLWFCLHSLFHLQIWAHRGFPFDRIFWFDLVAVVLPAFLVLWAALNIRSERTLRSHT